MKFTAAFLAPLLFLGQAVQPPVTSTSKLAWDPVLLDMAGKPETVASYEVAVHGVAVNLNSGGTPLRSKVIAAPVTEATIADLVTGLTDGPIAFSARARDTAGNTSTWTTLQTVLDSSNPRPPGNFKIVVTVTITTP